MTRRLYLSVPHMGESEARYVQEAFSSNWLSTVGPNLDAFEAEFSRRLGLPSVALASGTAALHLGLRLLGVGPGDEVLCPTLTFVASVNPVTYLGAEATFLDVSRDTWNLDPGILEEVLSARAREGRLPKCVVVVDLYGQSADLDPILASCDRHGVPVLEDAAEALGASYKGHPAGSRCPVSAFSFNGNKIITTTGGGMLACRDPSWTARARFWSQQARDPGVAYHHTQLGYNYRLSNVLAGIGRGQLEVLENRVARRRAVCERYREALADLEGLSLMPEAPYGLHTRWLTVFTVDAARLGVDRDALLAALEAENIEARPVWKPMNIQPLYAHRPSYGGAVGEDLYHRGLCLPSSSSLSEGDVGRVVATLRGAVERAARARRRD
ncbi:MAG: DegT/DnrJ/EryC1/StrS family aminotransferase [Deltaproteobacteria bacterium]|nr:DegT/DnrJ/EryC1/StrS family aminotransferase [Deltaproteobacteria bacterium]